MRQTTYARKTAETDITLTLNLDGNGTVNRNDAVAIVSYLTGKTTQLKPKKEES